MGQFFSSLFHITLFHAELENLAHNVRTMWVGEDFNGSTATVTPCTVLRSGIIMLGLLTDG